MQITTTNYNGHKLPPTCITMSGSSTCYTGSKDKCLISWDIETGKKNRIIKQAHSDHILSVAVSSDDKYLASSGRDKMIRIWDVRSPQSTHIFQLSGHFKDVTGVAFQSGTYQLYSSSLDRTVRVWDASQGSFVDTLYGHEGEVSCVDCMYNPRCLTAANDNSLRLWKVFEESQLVFNLSKTVNIDCAKLMREGIFLSGSQDGSVCLWSSSKRKPLVKFENAHGGEWINSVGTVRFSDVCATGSSDGYLKLWRARPAEKQLDQIANIAVPGFINGISMSDDGRVMVACVGQEHRLGRWTRNSSAKNGIVVVRMQVDQDAESEEDEEISDNDNDDE
ncbi:U3 small nucleolar RNA-interacting protein [Acrasis kona]|uniref:U3 small nucleolar RNA-interacting protein n=1 Tax=Acrasis kona TaxID=1008807 RepID=A0AAW2YKF2_9EUKA